MVFGPKKASRPECDLAFRRRMEGAIDELLNQAAREEVDGTVSVSDARNIRGKLHDNIRIFIDKCGPLEVKGQRFGNPNQAVDALLPERKREVRSGLDELDDEL